MERRSVNRWAQDVATAFDALQHDLIGAAMSARGIRPFLLRALLQEITGLTASLEVPGAGHTDSFPYNVGGV